LTATKGYTSDECLIDTAWFKVHVHARKGLFGGFSPHSFQARWVIPILRLTSANHGNIDHEPSKTPQHLIESVQGFLFRQKNMIPA
jgi:hypothetical protein